MMSSSSAAVYLTAAFCCCCTFMIVTEATGIPITDCGKCYDYSFTSLTTATMTSCEGSTKTSHVHETPDFEGVSSNFEQFV